MSKLNEVKNRPFLIILISTAISIGLILIHVIIIYNLWITAGWPISSSKYQNGIFLVSFGIVLGMIIISMNIISWVSRRLSYKKTKTFVLILNIFIILMSICGIIMSTSYGYICLMNISDFPEYGTFFVWRAFCLWAAAISLCVTIFGGIQSIRN